MSSASGESRCFLCGRHYQIPSLLAQPRLKAKWSSSISLLFIERLTDSRPRFLHQHAMHCFPMPPTNRRITPEVVVNLPSWYGRTVDTGANNEVYLWRPKM